MDWYFSNKIDNEIFKSNAQAFEDLFCNIMKANDDNFVRVKASGRDGDNSCDGFNNKTGDYYCIYAPENFKKDYTINNGLKKIKDDINGITSHWKNIKKINYVINDKFDGLPPKINKLIIELNQDELLPEVQLFSMDKLKEITLALPLEKKEAILGFAPDLTNSISTLQFSIIEEIIKYLEQNVKVLTTDGKLIVPDYSEKIEFNHLSQQIRDLLNSARYQVNKVDEFFETNSIYDKETLRNYCNGLYVESCNQISEKSKNFADRRFVYILDAMTYNKQSKAVVDNIIIIMANFFESCDIFEEPY